MKNKYIILVCLSFICLASCTKKDPALLFDKSTAEREDAMLHQIENQLAGGNGWIADIYTKDASGKAYSFFFKFDKTNRVKTLSDIDTTTASVAGESSYRLRALQQPTIVFDTYGYIHRLSDPMPASGGVGGSPAVGLKSDYSFGIEGISVDSLVNHADKIQTIKTKGRFNELPVTFRKATAAEAAFWEGGGINSFKKMIAAFMEQGFLYADLTGGLKASFDLDLGNKTVSFSWLDPDGTPQSVKTSFTFEMNELSFKDSIKINDDSFKNLYWQSNKLNYFPLKKEAQAIKVSAAPVFPLHLLLGSDPYTDILVPNATNSEGWGQDFITRRAATAAQLLSSGFNLRLGVIDFNFTSSNKKMQFIAEIPQGTSMFYAVYNFTYSKTPEGVFTFAKDGADYYGNGNAQLGPVDAAFNNLTAQRLLTDRFTIEYYVTTSGELKGAIKSVDNPTFVITGSF